MATSNIKARSYAYIKNITATSITAVSTATKVPITSLANGSGFVYSSTDKGVKCLKSGNYSVSIDASFESATDSDLVGVALYVNGSVAVGPSYTRYHGNYDEVVTPSRLLQLNENDVVTVFIRNNTGARGKCGDIRILINEL